MAGIGRIQIDGKPYNIALDPDSYKVTEIPTHGDVDPKMERRVIWRDFSLGIQRRREDPSMDATSSKSTTFTYMRQIRNPEGFYWATGCDTTRQNRVFAQRATTASNMNIASEKFAHFIDGSLQSITFSQNKVYTLAPPGTWTLSASLSTAGEITDGVQYGGQIYIGLGPTNGTSSGITATTLTDASATWQTNQFVGGIVTVGVSTATVTGNTATVLSFASWTGGTPANNVSSYQILKGFYTWNQLSSGSWTQRTPSATHFTVIREQLWRSINANIYSTINTDPANQIWSGATIIGDPGSPITALDVFQDFLMIFKQDGVYSADKTGNVYPIFPGFKTLGTNPRPIGQWQDSYYFAADVGLIWAYSPRGGVRRVGFDFAEPYPMNPTDPTTKYSIPNVATLGIPLTNYMIVGFNQYGANANSPCYYFAWDGTGWHPIKFFPTASAIGCGMTGGNLVPANPILHFCNIPAGGNTQIYYMTAPLIDPFIAASFDTAVQTMYFPADHGALEDEYKVLERVNVFVESPTTGKIKMAYALDDEIPTLTFHDMGDPQFQAVQGNQVFNPPTPLPTYVKIMLRLTITANTSAASPAIRNVVLHYHQRFPQRREWDISLIAEQNLVSAGGRIDTRSAKKIILDLNTARINHKQVVLQDAMLDQINVYINEVAQTIKVLKGNRNPSFLVLVKMIEAVDGK
jgi:hypothetical protein